MGETEKIAAEKNMNAALDAAVENYLQAMRGWLKTQKQAEEMLDERVHAKRGSHQAGNSAFADGASAEDRGRAANGPPIGG